MTLFRALLIASLSLALVACQSHLPPLETSPDYPGPRSTDIVKHLKCELWDIMNSDLSDKPSSKNTRMNDRLQDSRDKDDLRRLLPYLSKYHFVASAQFTLEVTDNEGVNPALKFITKDQNLTDLLNLQLTGTQDRSINIAYGVDLYQLAQEIQATHSCNRPVDSWKTQAFEHGGLTGGIEGGIDGDLGLADIIADGLLALDATANNNLYGGSGPALAPVPRHLTLSGALASDPTHLNVTSDFYLDGWIVFQPQAASSSTQGSVALNGIATLTTATGNEIKFIINWSGSMPPVTSSDDAIYFTLTGPLTPAPAVVAPSVKPTPSKAWINGNIKATSDFIDAWSGTPSVTLAGEIDPKYDPLSTFTLDGTVSPGTAAQGSKTAPGNNAGPSTIKLGGKATTIDNGQKIDLQGTVTPTAPPPGAPAPVQSAHLPLLDLIWHMPKTLNHLVFKSPSSQDHIDEIDGNLTTHEVASPGKNLYSVTLKDMVVKLRIPSKKDPDVLQSVRACPTLTGIIDRDKLPKIWNISGELTPCSDDTQDDQDLLHLDFGPHPRLTVSLPRSALVSSKSDDVTASIEHDPPEPAPPKAMALALKSPTATGTSSSGGGNGSSGGGSKGAAAAASGSAGTTSFGSTVDFTIVYGINGGPNWTYHKIVFPAAGSSPLLTTMRTQVDTLNITFVPACRDESENDEATIKDLWSSLAYCDEIGTTAASVTAYQQNHLQILQNLGFRQGGPPPQ